MAVSALDRQAHCVGMRVVSDGRLLEPEVETLALSDLQSGPESLVIRPKAHQAADDRLIGPMPFARPRERAVQLDARLLRCPADQTAREQTKSTRARCVGRGWSYHHGPDDVEKAEHHPAFLRCSGFLSVGLR